MSPISEKIKEVYKRHIAQDVDGYYYFCPDNGCGIFAPHILRQIADALDEMNKPWEAIIEKELSKNQ